MENHKAINYLDITDDEKSVPILDDSSSSFFSDSESSKPKKVIKKRSRSRSRKHKKKDKKEKKNKKDKKPKKDNKDYKPKHSESPKRNKWSTVETNEKQPQVVKVPVKKSKKNDNLADIKPNENIKVEEKEKPNFNPKETILAKDTNTVKYIILIISGVVLKFTEPLDAAMPDSDWRLYTFKDNDIKGITNVYTV
jgi:hypothetical protein